MAVYVIFQYFMLPDATVWSLFLNHLWHVLVLGVFIYALCWLVFQKLLQEETWLIILIKQFQETSGILSKGPRKLLKKS